MVQKESNSSRSNRKQINKSGVYMAKLTIILNAKNKPLTEIQKTLDSIFACTEKNIVVSALCLAEDHSILTKKFKSVNWIKTTAGTTITQMWASALEFAEDYVCFLDAGCEMFFAYHENLLQQALKSHADILIGDVAFKSDDKIYEHKHALKTKAGGSWGSGFSLKAYLENHFSDTRVHALSNKIFTKSLMLKTLPTLSALNFSTPVASIALTYFAIKNARQIKYSRLGHISITQTTDISENFIKELSEFFNVIQSDISNHELSEILMFHLKECKKLTAKTCLKLAKKQNNLPVSSLVKDLICHKPAVIVPIADRIHAQTRKLPANINVLNNELKKIYSSNKHLWVFSKRNSYTHKILHQLKQNLSIKFEFIDNFVNANIILSEDKF